MISQKELKENYRKACTDYANTLCEMWELEPNDKRSWWVSDDVGGLFCMNDDTFIGMNEIRYCVDNGIDFDTFSDWQDYCIKCESFGLTSMNLEAFVRKESCIPEETFQKLSDIRSELNELVEETKKKYK